MIQFKLNKKPLSVPTAWDDLTYQQYTDYTSFKGDSIDTLSFFTCISRETLLKADIVGAETLIQALQFTNKSPVIPTSFPQIGKYKLPLDAKGEFNIQFKRLDQFEDMRKAFPKDNTLKSLMDAYPLFVAIYLQHLKDGSYSYSKALAMVSEVKQMPALEVLSMGSFFLIKLLSLLTGMQKTSHHIKPKRKKLKRVLKISKRSSGHTLR